ncbi:MAG TPA: DUF116 domain-containing protein [Methanomicrobiales archaeon]|nr:DUF116 domain-containing protein [Methanomicrobiales archaeon]
MLFDSPLWNSTMILLGEAAVVIAVFLIAMALFLLVIALLSVRNGHLYLPRLMKTWFFLLEGLVKAICRFFGLDDRDLLSFSIRLQNSMNKKSFEAVPVEKRAVFLPQCLRSANCPGKLTPEGIKCQGCGQCTTCEGIRDLGGMGYRVFIVPGSSFIKRMVKKYRPEGIIGVGCILEVKEGLDLCDRLGIPGMGVVTLKDGCVETFVNWHEVLDVASLGTPLATRPEGLRGPPE